MRNINMEMKNTLKIEISRNKWRHERETQLKDKPKAKSTDLTPFRATKEEDFEFGYEGV